MKDRLIDGIRFKLWSRSRILEDQATGPYNSRPREPRLALFRRTQQIVAQDQGEAGREGRQYRNYHTDMARKQGRLLKVLRWLSDPNFIKKAP